MLLPFFHPTVQLVFHSFFCFFKFNSTHAFSHPYTGRAGRLRHALQGHLPGAPTATPSAAVPAKRPNSGSKGKKGKKGATPREVERQPSAASEQQGKELEAILKDLKQAFHPDVMSAPQASNAAHTARTAVASPSKCLLKTLLLSINFFVFRLFRPWMGTFSACSASSTTRKENKGTLALPAL